MCAHKKKLLVFQLGYLLIFLIEDSLPWLYYYRIVSTNFLRKFLIITKDIIK